MSWFRKNPRPRRLVARPTRTSRLTTVMQALRQPGIPGSILIALLLVVLLASMDILPLNPLPFRRGQYLDRDITARLNFWVADPQRKDDATRAALAKTPATFVLNSEQLDEGILATLRKIPAQLAAAQSLDKVGPELRMELGLVAPKRPKPLPPIPTAKAVPLAAKATAAPTAATQPETSTPAVAATTLIPPAATALSPVGLAPVVPAPAVPAPVAPAPPTAAELEAQAKAALARKVLEDAYAKAKAEADAIDKKNQAGYDAWVQCAEGLGASNYMRYLNTLRDELLETLIVDSDRAREQKQRPALLDVKLVTPEQMPIVLTPPPTVVSLIPLENKDAIRKRVAELIAPFPQELQAGVQHVLTKDLLAQPLYRYDAQRTEWDRQASVEAVLNDPTRPGDRKYRAEQILVSHANSPSAKATTPHEGLTDVDLRLLNAEHVRYLSHQYEAHPWRRWAQAMGRAGLVTFLVILIAAYVTWRRREIIHNNGAGFALAALLIVSLGITKFTVSILALPPNAALLGVCIGAIVMTIVYNRLFALTVGGLLAILTVFQVRGDFDLLTILVAGMVPCIVQLREVRTRTKLITVSCLSAGVALAAGFALAARAQTPWTLAWHESLWAAGSVLLAGLIVQSILPVIERLFGIATGSTLLEWCDASKPLLKRLAMESPGTYNHSLQLGAMCESAAHAIGGHDLLARVGAYYHDIGKTYKPDYFTENQIPGETNRHDKLSPQMSMLVILGHVKNGLELARQYALPKQLREFIASHHGTTRVQYFYHAACKEAQARGEAIPDENNFRYPGPKPASKEAGILMLADGVESSVRSLGETTPTNIRAQVHRIVTSRLEDGQLDNCALTLRQVHAIEESFVKTLCAVYHGRIAYPSDDKEKKDDTHT